MLGGEDRHPRTIERGDGDLAEERLVTLVVGVGHHGDAGAEELGPGGGDEQLTAVLDPETDIEEEPLPGPVLDLGLGHGGLEVDVPHGRRLDVVDLAALDEIEEAQLRNAPAVIIDGGVRIGPVDGQAEVAPEVLEGFFVLVGDHSARLDEIASRNIVDALVFLPLLLGLPVRVVRQLGVASDPEQILHPPFRGQPVVIPTHGVGDVLADHPLVANDQILVGVAEDVTHVERTRNRRRWGVDDKGLLPRQGRVPTVDPPLLPLLSPLVLDLVVLVFLGNLGHSLLHQHAISRVRCDVGA